MNAATQTSPHAFSPLGSRHNPIELDDTDCSVLPQAYGTPVPPPVRAPTLNHALACREPPLRCYNVDHTCNGWHASSIFDHGRVHIYHGQPIILTYEPTPEATFEEIASINLTPLIDLQVWRDLTHARRQVVRDTVNSIAEDFNNQGLPTNRRLLFEDVDAAYDYMEDNFMNTMRAGENIVPAAHFMTPELDFAFAPLNLAPLPEADSPTNHRDLEVQVTTRRRYDFENNEDQDIWLNRD